MCISHWSYSLISTNSNRVSFFGFCGFLLFMFRFCWKVTSSILVVLKQNCTSSVYSYITDWYEKINSVSLHSKIYYVVYHSEKVAIQWWNPLLGIVWFRQYLLAHLPLMTLNATRCDSSTILMVVFSFLSQVSRCALQFFNYELQFLNYESHLIAKSTFDLLV